MGGHSLDPPPACYCILMLEQHPLPPMPPFDLLPITLILIAPFPQLMVTAITGLVTALSMLAGSVRKGSLCPGEGMQGMPCK